MICLIILILYGYSIYVQDSRRRQKRWDFIEVIEKDKEYTRFRCSYHKQSLKSKAKYLTMMYIIYLVAIMYQVLCQAPQHWEIQYYLPPFVGKNLMLGETFTQTISDGAEIQMQVQFYFVGPKVQCILFIIYIKLTDLKQIQPYIFYHPITPFIYFFYPYLCLN